MDHPHYLLSAEICTPETVRVVLKSVLSDNAGLFWLDRLTDPIIIGVGVLPTRYYYLDNIESSDAIRLGKLFIWRGRAYTLDEEHYACS